MYRQRNLQNYTMKIAYVSLTKGSLLVTLKVKQHPSFINVFFANAAPPGTVNILDLSVITRGNNPRGDARQPASERIGFAQDKNHVINCHVYL